MTVQRQRDVLIWGLILIFFGCIFLLHNLNVEVWDILSRLWPLILIIWGGWKLFLGLKERNEKPSV